MQAHKTGLWSIANASTAERLFDGTVRQLHGILEQHALAPAIAQFADRSLDAGASPNWNPICLGRKPLEGTVAQNLAKWGVGALNIDGCRVGTEVRHNAPAGNANNPDTATGPAQKGGFGMRADTEGTVAVGRWPANVVHDGSDDVLAGFPDSKGQQGDVRGTEPSGVTDEIYGKFSGRVPSAARNDSGSAARFFYTAKADADDRLGSSHPTVKPVDLMQWLVRLVTPKGGLVLDPFAGTGTTGEAAFREGMRAVLIEREAAFYADIQRRIDLLLAGPAERRRESIKARIASGRIKDEPLHLFSTEEATP